MTKILGDYQKQELLNLAKYLETNPERLEEPELFSIVEQIASALDHLHEKDLFHGSLKLNHVLVTKKQDRIEISLAESLEKEEAQRAPSFPRFFENLAFLAPEQKTTSAIEVKKCDVFAFGVLVYFMIMRHYPEGVFPLPSKSVPEYQLPWDDLITACLQFHPARRPTALKALVHTLNSSQHKKGELRPVLKPQEVQRPEFQEDPGAIFQKETTIAPFKPKEQKIAHVEPLLTNMIVIAGGSYYRGSNSGSRDEMPRHVVQLGSFAIDIHPVTNEQFVRFLEVMGGEKNAQNCDMIRLRESRIKRSGGKLIIESGYAKHPVVGVAWYGAIAYAQWIGKRLPTEAEWEIAASSGNEERIFPAGNTLDRTQANFFSSDTTAVMSYPPNDFGLYDMAGNVYEWCSDWYDHHYYDASVQEPNDPGGPQQGVYRALRGGCWKSLKEDMRCSHRHRNNPGTMNGTYGFRCAADVM